MVTSTSPAPAGVGGYLPSLIRTVVPVAVGAGLTWLEVHWHLPIPAGASATVGLTAAAVTVAGYYAAARAVEHRWPRVGRWLLAAGLAAGQPVYPPAGPGTPTP